MADTDVYIAIGATQLGLGRASDDAYVLAGSLTITDELDEMPNRCQFSVIGLKPQVGQEVVVTRASAWSDDRIFGGQVIQVDQDYLVHPSLPVYHVGAIDYTWGLDRRLVNARYTATSVTTIVGELVAAYAPGYTTTQVEAALPSLDEVSFTNTPLSQCLTQLAKRVGGYWMVDYGRDVIFYINDPFTASNPDDLVDGHATLESVQASYDASQLLSRVICEGGGSAALALVEPGETILPLADATWYSATGGRVASGPQRITYTGVDLGGGGGLIGPGSSPSATPVGVCVSGSGVETGNHDYAVTFTTASGESLVGPRQTVAVGTLSPPTSAPSTGSASQSTTGPDPGNHVYAVSFVTGSGETVPGPNSATVTIGSQTEAPASAPTLGDPTDGTGITPGTHGYAVTFVTSTGETTAGPSGSKATSTFAAPGTGPTAGDPTDGSGITPGSHDYAVSFVTGSGETTVGPSTTKATSTFSAPNQRFTVGPSHGTGVTLGEHTYTVTYVTAYGETTKGLTANTSTTTLDAPSSALTPSSPTPGGSVTEGSHEYVVTFVTAVGETLVGPTSSAGSTTGYVTAPGSAATASNDTGYSHSTYWAIGDQISAVLVYVNANGMTTAGPESNTVTMTESVEPGRARGLALASVPVSTDDTVTGKRVYLRVNGSWYGYKAISAGDTTRTVYGVDSGGSPPGSNSASRVSQTVPLSGIPTGGAVVTARKIYRRFNGSGSFKLLTTINDNTTTTYSDTTANASLGADAPSTNTAYNAQMELSSLPIGPSGVTGRRIYRTEAGGAQFKLVATINDNTTLTYTDTKADGSLGANVPTSNTAYKCRIALSSIPTGPSGVTGRKVYRTAAGGATLKLLTTIYNNTATTYDDSTADGSLGADAPGSNTAYKCRIALSNIATGPAGVTNRKIYRTEAGGAQLKLLATLYDNTTTTYNDAKADGDLGANVPTENSTSYRKIALSAIPTGDGTVTGRKVYRTVAGGAQLKLLTTISDNTTTSYNDATNDASLGTNALTAGTATANKVALSSIPTGTSGVTGRKVYRTAAGASTLKLLATIGDNTTATYNDTTADASLGATAPSSDTSGLEQPTGQVLAGATSLPVADSGGFKSTGGWAVIGNGRQVIRYTGITGQALTGIPATGAGCISASVAYNSNATAAPALTGIPSSSTGSILYQILPGDQVNVIAQADDATAQSLVAALLATGIAFNADAFYTGAFEGRSDDGIIEGYLQDNRLSEAEALVRATAQLQLRTAVEVALTYVCRDIKTRAGRTVDINLASPTSIAGTFKIQRVVMSEFHPSLLPKFTVTASATRFTFEQLLRLVRRNG